MNANEVLEGMALNAALYIKSVTPEMVEAGQGIDAFTLSFVMEILTSKDKQECLDMIMAAQDRIRKAEENIDKMMVPNQE